MNDFLFMCIILMLSPNEVFETTGHKRQAVKFGHQSRAQFCLVSFCIKNFSWYAWDALIISKLAFLGLGAVCMLTSSKCTAIYDNLFIDYDDYTY